MAQDKQILKACVCASMILYLKGIEDMKQFSYVIKDELGIHARPAGMLAKEAKAFASVVTVAKGDSSVKATQLMKLMSLGVKKGDEVVVAADGADEDAAVAALQAFFETNL